MDLADLDIENPYDAEILNHFKKNRKNTLSKDHSEAAVSAFSRSVKIEVGIASAAAVLAVVISLIIFKSVQEVGFNVKSSNIHLGD